MLAYFCITNNKFKAVLTVLSTVYFYNIIQHFSHRKYNDKQMLDRPVKAFNVYTCRSCKELNTRYGELAKQYHQHPWDGGGEWYTSMLYCWYSPGLQP